MSNRDDSSFPSTRQSPVCGSQSEAFVPLPILSPYVNFVPLSAASLQSNMSSVYSPSACLLAAPGFPCSAILASIGSHVQNFSLNSLRPPTEDQCRPCHGEVAAKEYLPFCSSTTTADSILCFSDCTTLGLPYDRNGSFICLPPPTYTSNVSLSTDKCAIFTSGHGLSERSDLSGREGSLKHRILTRPSKTEETGSIHHASRYEDNQLLCSLDDHTATDFPSLSIFKQQCATSISLHSSSLTMGNVFVSASSSSVSSANSFISRQHCQCSLSHTHHHHTHSHNAFCGHTGEHSSSSIPIFSSPMMLSENQESQKPNETVTNGVSHLYYPPHFIKGSIIQLANGDLKHVEDLLTEDFVCCAEDSTDLKVDSSTVVGIEENSARGTATLHFSVGEPHIQVSVEATLEHPFFVFGRGWSSCSTERSLLRYGLNCHQLVVGDVCVSLTHKDVPSLAVQVSGQQEVKHAVENGTCRHQEKQHLVRDSDKGVVERVDHRKVSCRSCISGRKWRDRHSNCANESSGTDVIVSKECTSAAGVLSSVPSTQPSTHDGGLLCKEAHSSPPLAFTRTCGTHSKRRRSTQEVDDLV